MDNEEVMFQKAYADFSRNPNMRISYSDFKRKYSAILASNNKTEISSSKQNVISTESVISSENAISSDCATVLSEGIPLQSAIVVPTLGSASPKLEQKEGSNKSGDSVESVIEDAHMNRTGVSERFQFDEFYSLINSVQLPSCSSGLILIPIDSGFHSLNKTVKDSIRKKENTLEYVKRYIVPSAVKLEKDTIYSTLHHQFKLCFGVNYDPCIDKTKQLEPFTIYDGKKKAIGKVLAIDPHHNGWLILYTETYFPPDIISQSSIVIPKELPTVELEIQVENNPVESIHTHHFGDDEIPVYESIKSLVETFSQCKLEDQRIQSTISKYIKDHCVRDSFSGIIRDTISHMTNKELNILESVVGSIQNELSDLKSVSEGSCVIQPVTLPKEDLKDEERFKKIISIYAEKRKLKEKLFALIPKSSLIDPDYVKAFPKLPKEEQSAFVEKYLFRKSNLKMDRLTSLDGNYIDIIGDNLMRSNLTPNVIAFQNKLIKLTDNIKGYIIDNLL